MNRLNAPVLGMDEVKVFEIGTVFLSADVQEMHVAYADKKGVIEMKLEEFATDSSWIPAQGRDDTIPNTKKFTPWSAFPFIARDIAVFVPAGTAPEELLAICSANAGDLLSVPPRLFDQFTKGDQTSLAIRMVFQSPERTLTDAEVTEIMAKMAEAVAQKGWTVR